MPAQGLGCQRATCTLKVEGKGQGPHRHRKGTEPARVWPPAGSLATVGSKWLALAAVGRGASGEKDMSLERSTYEHAVQCQEETDGSEQELGEVGKVVAGVQSPSSERHQQPDLDGACGDGREWSFGGV